MGGMGGGGREVQEGGDICTHIADSFLVQQKLTQHCKAIILQKQNKTKKLDLGWSRETLPEEKALQLRAEGCTNPLLSRAGGRQEGIMHAQALTMALTMAHPRN